MISRVRIENFKAIGKAAGLPLQPFTVFIGNNGSGKSSVFEALQTLQTAYREDIDKAFRPFGGLDRVLNFRAAGKRTIVDEQYGELPTSEPIILALTATVAELVYEYQVHFNQSFNGDQYLVEHEELVVGGKPVYVGEQTSIEGKNTATLHMTDVGGATEFTYQADTLLLGIKNLPTLQSQPFLAFQEYVESWQFLYLNAHELGKPSFQNRLARRVQLEADGRNLAQYLLWLRNNSEEAWESMLRKLQFVLPYVSDLQPSVNTTALNDEIELLMYEKSEEQKRAIPGWLLSSGTLRILALLAMFDTPRKPSVLFVDEIENGLDPRTVGLLISLIEGEFHDEAGMQVVATSHSPYLLDLVPLESIIVAEKGEGGSEYHLPKDDESLNAWKERFAPGRLYTMGKLTR